MRNTSNTPTFLEWSGLFSDKLFVMTQMLESFSDESATHDLTGQHPGAASPTMAGLIADRSYWSVFRKKWEKILNKYGVENFHFVDWVQHKKPYEQWNNINHYAFACELDSLIGEVALPAGGSSNAKRYSELIPEDNPWEKSVEGFYRNVIVQL
jgi:hypothetical protein